MNSEQRGDLPVISEQASSEQLPRLKHTTYGSGISTRCSSVHNWPLVTDNCSLLSSIAASVNKEKIQYRRARNEQNRYIWGDA